MDEIVGVLQKKEREMLKQTVSAFDEAGIKYFVACGTCLGTIRHKGFIPWDDDVDIYIFGNDYEKAKAVFINHPYLEWHDNETHNGYPFTFPKIVAKNTILIEKGKNDIEYREGVYIDVFPLIDTPKCRLLLFFSEKMRYVRYAIIRLIYTNYESKFRTVLRKIAKSMFDPEKIQKKIFDSYKKIRNGKKVIIDSGVFGKHGYIFKDSFSENLLMPFEDINVSVPKGYKRYLTDYYGDYMRLPPIEKRVACHSCNYLMIDGKELLRK